MRSSGRFSLAVASSAFVLVAALALPLGAQTIQQQKGTTAAPKDAAPSTKGKTQQGGKDNAKPTKKAGVAKATTTLECANGKRYEVTTGNKSGSCAMVGAKGANWESVRCADSASNQASATCEKGCGPSSGSGSCTQK